GPAAAWRRRAPRGGRAAPRARRRGDRPRAVAGQRRVPRGEPTGGRPVGVLFGIETEYALTALNARGGRMNQAQVLDGLMRSARPALPHPPDELANGMFLANGARFYVDCGGHPEMTTPECTTPWDVVRYVRAGEAILVRLAEAPAAGRVAIFRGNVDYSGTRATWGCHESFMHSTSPARLA